MAFLDGDDEFLPGCLAAHAACRDSRPDVHLSLGSFRKRTVSGETRQVRLGDRMTDTMAGGRFGYVTDFHAGLIVDVPSCAIAIDRDFFIRLGGFDAQLRCWEISDFLLRGQLATAVTGIINDELTQIHEDDDNSQFTSHYQDSEYQRRFAHKLLDVMPRIPADQQLPLLKPIRNFLYQAWQSGDVSSFKVLARRLCPLLRDEQRPHKFCFLARLPDGLLAFMHRFF